MITPSFSVTATERILPKLALDFTTNVLDPRVSITRALDTATRVTSEGLIETVLANTPRFDHDPVTYKSKGLLIENTVANALRYSSALNESVWTKTNASISQDAVVSLDGTQNADKLVENNVSTFHVTFQTFGSASTSTTYTLSMFVKAAERTFGRVTLGNSSGSEGFYANVNLTNGTIGNTVVTGTNWTSTSSRIVAYKDGWYRISLTGTNASLTSLNSTFFLCNTSGNIVYLGDGTSGLYIWGAQLEANSFASSYIPTGATSLTRNADVVTMTGSNFSDWWTATNGSVAVQVSQMSVLGTRPWVQFDDTTTNNIIALQGNTTNPELYIKATTDQATIDAGTIAANTNYGFVGAWNTDDCAAAINGNAAVTDTSATIPTVTQARLGSDGTNYIGGHIQQIRYWPQRVTNAETQAFSKL